MARQPREPTHKFYVDDSGTKEYAPNGVYSKIGGGITPNFVFGGLFVSNAVAGRLTKQMQDLKEACFRRRDVEIKANWLRHGKEREKRYLKPYGITEDRLRQFVDDVYALIADSDCRLLAAIVLKDKVIEKYKARAYYAPAIAYECLVQRVQLEMKNIRGIVHITVDDMDGATPKGRQYRDNLERHHKMLVTKGSVLHKKYRSIASVTCRLLIAARMSAYSLQTLLVTPSTDSSLITQHR